MYISPTVGSNHQAATAIYAIDHVGSNPETDDNGENQPPQNPSTTSVEENDNEVMFYLESMSLSGNNDCDCPTESELVDCDATENIGTVHLVPFADAQPVEELADDRVDEELEMVLLRAPFLSPLPSPSFTEDGIPIAQAMGEMQLPPAVNVYNRDTYTTHFGHAYYLSSNFGVPLPTAFSMLNHIYNDLLNTTTEIDEEAATNVVLRHLTAFHEL